MNGHPGYNISLLERREAGLLLGKWGFSIGDWANIRYSSHSDHDEKAWDRIKAPSSVDRALRFSQLLMDWPPRAPQYVVQFDYSSDFSPDELFAFSAAIPTASLHMLNRGGTFCFGGTDDSVRIALAYVAFFCLMFEGHVYIVSSGTYAGNYLSLQDGYAYIMARQPNDVVNFQKTLQAEDVRKPQWVVDYSIRHQDMEPD